MSYLARGVNKVIRKISIIGIAVRECEKRGLIPDVIKLEGVKRRVKRILMGLF